MPHVFHLPLRYTLGFAFSKRTVCYFLLHEWTVGFPETRMVAVVSSVAKENIWLHIEFPESKLVHDLNLSQAYHNALRLC